MMEKTAIKAERNYGIDLLRIVAMGMVVMLHTLLRGGPLDMAVPLTLNGEITWIIECLCCCAVTCYALISGFVGYHSRHRYSGIIHMWLQVFFYSFGIAFLYVLYTVWSGDFQGVGKAAVYLFKAAIPALSKSYWYFSAYFCLFFVMPMLDAIIDNVPRKTLRISFVMMCIVFGVGDLFFSNPSFGVNGGYSFLWLAILYLLGAYMKRYNPFEKTSVFKSFLLYFICALTAYATRLLSLAVEGLGEKTFITYESVFIMFSGVFLFNVFRQIRLKEKICKMIAFLAPLSFGVYLLHDNAEVTSILFRRVVSQFEIITLPVHLYVPVLFAIVISVYVFATAVDFVRAQIFKLLRVKQLSVKIEEGMLMLHDKFFGDGETDDTGTAQKNT